MPHGGDKKAVQMPQGIVKKEGKFFKCRLIQKLFADKLSQQRSVFPQFSASDQLEKVRNTNFSSEREPEFFEVKNRRMLNAPGKTEGRLMPNPRDLNMSKCLTNAWGEGGRGRGDGHFWELTAVYK